MVSWNVYVLSHVLISSSHGSERDKDLETRVCLPVKVQQVIVMP
jgi:hypothetical protein